MKKSWLLLFLLIIATLTAGCSTSSSSISSSSTTPIFTSSEYNEIANAHFCVGERKGGYPNVTFEPPLIKDPSRADSYSVVMPIKPGKYKILVTTAIPEASVMIVVDYSELTGRDKFGNPLYYPRRISVGHSDRYADLNAEVLIPDNSIDGLIWIGGYDPGIDNNCGTLIVTRET